MNKKVARGAAWMDENYPGWYQHVNPETLDSSSDTQCVIGQEAGSFSRVMEVKFPLTSRYWNFVEDQPTLVYYLMIPPGLIFTILPFAWIIRHGFCRVNGDEQQWRASWRYEILVRLHADRYSLRKDGALVESSDLALSA